MARPKAPSLMFIGTQQQGQGAGIQAAGFDEATGRITTLGLAAEIDRPTWLLSSPRRGQLYAVSEVGNQGDREGEVLSFAIPPTGWRLRLLGRTPSGGGGATHLVMNRRQDTLFVANFGGGSVATYAVGADGGLTASGLPQPTAGSGPHRRQNGPHPHGVTLDPSGRFLLVPDMGSDRVFVFRHHRDTRRLSAAAEPFLQMPAGSGPRLLLYGRDRSVCYLLSELSAELFVLRWDGATGRLSSMATVALDRPGASHARSAAALAISRDGRRLYTSNRGTNQIQTYAIDRRSGLLTELQRVDAGGLKPWSATLSPAGTWLLVANQGSNAVSVFKVEADGRLLPIASGVTVLSPTSVTFAGRCAGAPTTADAGGSCVSTPGRQAPRPRGPDITNRDQGDRTLDQQIVTEPTSVGMQQPATAPGAAPSARKGVMLMNRIGPSRSQLFVSDADGANERALLPDGTFEYHAQFSPDGAWITFTSEREGDGQADIYRCRPDGSGLEAILATPSVEDGVALSHDGTHAAYVSTADGYKANVWVLDLDTGERRNLTGHHEIAGDPKAPDGYFRPSWSPDGAWLAFSSDRNTGWTGHSDGHGWEHTQELSVYVIRPDGSGLRRLASKPGHCLGSPKWSADGTRIVFYEIETEHTWGAHRPEWIGRCDSQIVSVDVATGEHWVEHTSGPGIKLSPQFIGGTHEVGFLIKGGPHTGLHYSNGAPSVLRNLRSPAWSADGRQMVYEKVDFAFREQNKPLFSWDPEWEYRSTDVFPVLSRQGRIAVTQKQLGNSSVVTMKPDGSDQRVVFSTDGKGLDPVLVKKGLSGAFYPAWSPDGAWLAFGVGSWFQERRVGKATIMRARSDGSFFEPLTDGSVHSGFPSYSADGRHLVFRVWGEGQRGLRVMDLEDRGVRVLTTETDNLPFWSPDGALITFTRKTGPTNFDVCTIRPDGSELKVLTETGANDGHSVWTHDNKILWSSGMYGFRDEAANYDFTFQPYGQIFIMDADGGNKRILTDSLWEDSVPVYIPAEFL